MVQGLNQADREATLQKYVGATVHLLDSTNAIADSGTTVSSNASVTTADSDWSLTSDNTAGTTTLENTSAVDFGQVSGFTVDQVVLEATGTADALIVVDGPSGDLDLSGDGETSFEAGQLKDTLGGE